MTMRRGQRYDERFVCTIDVADPADVERARDRDWRIGPIYDGGSRSVAEPCAADCFEEWTCAAREQSLPEPADCDWPFCGCDPYADKVIAALEECGVLQDRAALKPHAVSELDHAAKMIRAWMPESFPANERGQVHFVRAIMESVADVIERAIQEAQGIVTGTAETSEAQAPCNARERDGEADAPREDLGGGGG